MKNLCITLLLILLARGAWAAKRKSHHSTSATVAKPAKAAKPAPTYDMLAIKPLDAVFKHLDDLARHPRDRHARALSSAQAALDAKKTGQARRFASRALRSDLADYAHWIIASADLIDAEAAATANLSSTH